MVVIMVIQIAKNKDFPFHNSLDHKILQLPLKRPAIVVSGASLAHQFSGGQPFKVQTENQNYNPMARQQIAALKNSLDIGISQHATLMRF